MDRDRIQSAAHGRNESGGSNSSGLDYGYHYHPNFYPMPSIDWNKLNQPQMVSNTSNTVSHSKIQMPLFKSISDKIRSITSISRRKRSSCTPSGSGLSNDMGCEVMSPHSQKSRTSISLTQPGIDGDDHHDEEEKEHSVITNVTMSYPNAHKISLSADQLTSLQHGLAVQTGDGVRIKLEPNTKKKGSIHSRKYSHYNVLEEEDESDNESRNNVTSLIQGYHTVGAPNSRGSSNTLTHLTTPHHYAKVGSKSLDHHVSMDGSEESSTESHESMYNLLHKDEDTDGYITTPTAGRESDFEVKKEILHIRK